jgi:hypothetical protein
VIEYDVEKSTYFSLQNPCTGSQSLLVIRVQLTDKEQTLYWLQSTAHTSYRPSTKIKKTVKQRNVFLKLFLCSVIESWLDQILTPKDHDSEWHAIRPSIIVKLVLEILMTESV